MSNPCAIAVLAVLALLPAQDESSKQIKAVQPEVQTAEWAKAWWMPRHEQKLADAKKLSQIDLLMIGDSITHGWENGGKEVWKEFYDARHAFNIGFSGDRTEHVLWRLQHDAVKGMDPKLVVLMIGTNNTGHRQDKPEHIALGIEQIVGELKTRLPRAKILVLAIFPRGKDAGDKLRKINDATNPIIAKLADNKRVFFLDINQKFLIEAGVLPKETMPDLLHPNAKGYRIWAEAMEPTIRKLMQQGASSR